jgi:hypothetical protein
MGMTYWTEAAIAKHLEGRFFALEQLNGGQFRVMDRNEVPEPEEVLPAASRWMDADLVHLVKLKRQGKTHAQCAEVLDRTEAAIMDKWQSRAGWKHRVSVPRTDPIVWLEDIARVVCGVYCVSKAEFFSIRRNPRIVEARQVFFWLAKNYTSFTFPKIGAFCGRDHSTVMHGFGKVGQQIDRYRSRIELCVFDLGLEMPTAEAA